MKTQILMCVGGLAMHRGADGAIFFSAQEDVKEGELPIRLLHRELYAGVNTVQIAVKGVDQVRGECCAHVIHISRPKPWDVRKVDSASCSTSSMTRFVTTTDTGDPIAVP